MNKILIEVSVGELFDKISILEIKKSKIKDSAKIFLSMAMAAIGLSANLKELKSMGYKPFIVGFIAMITVGLVSITTMHLFTKLF